MDPLSTYAVAALALILLVFYFVRKIPAYLALSTVVAAGQSAGSLAITALHENGATIDDLAGNALEGVVGDVGGRTRAGIDHRLEVIVERGDRLEEAADRQIHASQSEHGVATAHRRKAFSVDKTLVSRLGRREGVGFMLETGNQDIFQARVSI